MEIGMNARPCAVVIVGWARVGLLSVEAAASATYAATTPSELTPFHWDVPMVKVLATVLTGFRAPLRDMITVGSRVNGIAKPPVGPAPIARWVRSAWTADTAWTAATSWGVNRR